MPEPEDRNQGSRLVARRLVAENSRFEVFFDHIAGADGSEVPEYLTVRPRVQIAGQVSGVCVLPEIDGRIGLMHIRRHTFDTPIWQAPGGFSEEGEDPALTARRELTEETGYHCPEANLVALGSMIPDAGIMPSRVALYVARGMTVADRRDDGPLAWEPGWGRLQLFERPAVERLVDTDPAIGAATVIAVYRYLRLF